jgi:hypothetical protein
VVTETTPATNLDAQVQRAVSRVLVRITATERAFWRVSTVTSTIIAAYSILQYLTYSDDLHIIFRSWSSFATIVGTCSGIILIPEFFRITFGEYPLTLFLRGALERDIKSQAMDSLSGFRRHVEVLTVTPFVAEEKDAAVSSLDPRELMALYGESTSKLAERIFKRSNAHLFAGGVIAAIGIGVFLYRSSQISSTSEWKEILRVLAPGFGILF